MKISFKKKNQVKIALILLGAILIASGVYLGLKFFWKKSANVTPSNFISDTASITYTIEGQTSSDLSNTVRVQKVNLFNLISLLQGRSSQNLNGIEGTMTVIDPDADTELGSTPFIIGSNVQSQPDWTIISAITDLSKRYDLKISIAGRLSKKIKDVNLEQATTVDSGSLLAGDVYCNTSVNKNCNGYGDGVINWEDYNAWSKDYGKTRVGNDEPNDFNGDGVINYLDFAIAYGSSNWLKTEASQ